MLVPTQSPQLDSFVIGCRSHDFLTWVEGNPVYSFLMTFDDMLDLYFRTAKDFIGAGALSLLHTSLFKF
jgi:hypothetical protein